MSKDRSIVEIDGEELSGLYREIDALNDKVVLLKRLLLMVHPSVSNEPMSHIAVKQWQAYIRTYPDEV